MEPQYNEIGRAGSYTDSPDNIILTSLPSTVFGKNTTRRAGDFSRKQEA